MLFSCTDDKTIKEFGNVSFTHGKIELKSYFLIVIKKLISRLMIKMTIKLQSWKSHLCRITRLFVYCTAFQIFSLIFWPGKKTARAGQPRIKPCQHPAHRSWRSDREPAMTYNSCQKTNFKLRLTVCNWLSHSPMVQIMLVLRAVIGSWSMSSRQRCSRKVSAMLASSCWRWMKESGRVITSE